MTLNEFFSIHPESCSDFPGGVDSAYLLYAAVRNGAQCSAVFCKDAFQPEFELRRLASRRRAEGPPDCAGIRYFIHPPRYHQSF